MKIERPEIWTLAVTSDEIKLVSKYRECLEKLKPGQSGVGRSWSFPLVDSPGDQINVSVSVAHGSYEPVCSASEVIVEGSKARVSAVKKD